jgi:hypothetical protein
MNQVRNSRNIDLMSNDLSQKEYYSQMNERTIPNRQLIGSIEEFKAMKEELIKISHNADQTSLKSSA